MAKEMKSTLPYNLEAEQSVLGSMLIDPELQFEIRSKLNVEDFCVESHKLVFEGICAVLDDNKALDLVTLTDEMNKTPYTKNQKRKVDLVTLAETLEKQTTLEKAGGIEYLTELSRATPSAANYEYYLNIVKRDSVLRKLIRGADEIILDCKVSTDSFKSIARAESIVYSISEQLETSSLTNIKGDIGDVIDYFRNIQEDKNFMQGLKTGFTCLDAMTQGLHKGNMVIIAARPSVGKTTFVMNIVEHVAIKRGAVCAVFALEMTKKELAERMMYSVACIDSQLARNGQLSTDDWSSLWNAQKILEATDIFVDDTSTTTVPDILSKCRRLKANKGKLDLVVIDHIQLMNAVRPNDSRQAEITEISRGLKMIAKELDVPVVVLSQLSRSVEKNARKPILSDLRESGAIEQDADIVMFIHRPEMTPDGKSENAEEVKKDEAEIIVSKNRSGPRGSFSLVFKGEQSRFANIDTKAEEPFKKLEPQNNDKLKQLTEEDDPLN